MTKIPDNASAIICFQDKVLMFHRDNIPTIPFPDHWHLPGGAIEPGETPDQGIRRELSEEITHIPQSLALFTSYSNPDGHHTYIFIAKVTEAETKLFKKGPDEGQEIAFFTLSQINDLKTTPHFKIKLSKAKPELEKLLKEEI